MRGNEKLSRSARSSPEQRRRLDVDERMSEKEVASSSDEGRAKSKTFLHHVATEVEVTIRQASQFVRLMELGEIHRQDRRTGVEHSEVRRVNLKAKLVRRESTDETDFQVAQRHFFVHVFLRASAKNSFQLNARLHGRLFQHSALLADAGRKEKLNQSRMVAKDTEGIQTTVLQPAEQRDGLIEELRLAKVGDQMFSRGETMSETSKDRPEHDEEMKTEERSSTIESRGATVARTNRIGRRSLNKAPTVRRAVQHHLHLQAMSTVLKKSCGKCQKIVYPAEEIKCLDQVRHSLFERSSSPRLSLSLVLAQRMFQMFSLWNDTEREERQRISEDALLSRVSVASALLFFFISLSVNRHYPQPKPTMVADNPEMQRIRLLTDIQSNVGLRRRSGHGESVFSPRRSITKISTRAKESSRRWSMAKNINDWPVKRAARTSIQGNRRASDEVTTNCSPLRPQLFSSSR